ncbi:hypothetical protein [Kitasatospora herbaricolor]|uniref:SnoaL-like domain-containing protein n=1 Tax=Kitasatospora herbaricolor TaxID=68217 RepID=A0ABZ1WIL3_9ACTN|nr:hypothetical protein [Kitasatospora herbaricolor]
MTTETLVDIWQRLLADPHKSWVLYEHGTCVVLTDPAEDLAGQATEILGAFGPARPGSPSGDFGVINVRDADGWVVTGDHRDILTYVAPEDLDDRADLTIGLRGRAKRHLDGSELHVIHVEDGRGAAGPE